MNCTILTRHLQCQSERLHHAQCTSVIPRWLRGKDSELQDGTDAGRNLLNNKTQWIKNDSTFPQPSQIYIRLIDRVLCREHT